MKTIDKSKEQFFDKPLTMFKIIPNIKSNDYNQEPLTAEIKYQVWGLRGGKAFVNRTGWNGLKNRHWILTEGLYEREENTNEND